MFWSAPRGDWLSTRWLHDSPTVPPEPVTVHSWRKTSRAMRPHGPSTVTSSTRSVPRPCRSTRVATVPRNTCVPLYDTVTTSSLPSRPTGRPGRVSVSVSHEAKRSRAPAAGKKSSASFPRFRVNVKGLFARAVIPLCALTTDMVR